MITRLASIISLALISIASAHPGPAGHTHPDEWPFEPFVVAACIIATLWLAQLVIRKN